MTDEWDSDALLRVSNDSARTRKYRTLQSWYRHFQLGAEPGWNKPEGWRPKSSTSKQVRRLQGNLLTLEDGEQWLNFISSEAQDHALARIPVVKLEGGALDPNRLKRNMLSSMPMCFNVFGSLGERPALMARLLQELLGLDVDEIVAVHCEYATQNPATYLGDRSAFDAYVEYCDRNGGRRFLGIETKYTEPFSQKEYSEHDHPNYKVVTDRHDGWFKPESIPILMKSATNQLWRNTMLAAALEHEDDFVRGDVLVLALGEDEGAKNCVTKVSAQLVDTSRLHHLSLECLAESAASIDGLSTWAKRFSHRYLHPGDWDTRQVDPDGPCVGRSPTSVFG